MSRLRLLAVVAATMLAPLAAGCSADTSGDDVNSPSVRGHRRLHVRWSGLDAIAKEPAAVADIVFGADKVVFSKPMDQAKVETKSGEQVAKVISGLKADQVPDRNASFRRCLPSKVVTIHKGASELASIALNCGDDATGVVRGRLSAGDSMGAVDVDAGIVLGVEEPRARVRAI